MIEPLIIGILGIIFTATGSLTLATNSFMDGMYLWFGKDTKKDVQWKIARKHGAVFMSKKLHENLEKPAVKGELRALKIQFWGFILLAIGILFQITYFWITAQTTQQIEILVNVSKIK